MIVNFTQNELEQIHSIQLEMLKEVDRICRKCGIKYIISGGSLLGAVRNNAFIPWDDDIDVRMTRIEYNKFAKACQKELDTSKFFFQDHNTDPYYPWYYGKMRYIHSRYTRVGQEHMKMHNGIFIDIMPADGLPNNKFRRNITIIKCFVLKKFLYSVVGCVSEKNKLKRLIYTLMNKVPKKYIFNRFNKLSEHYIAAKYDNVTCYSFVRLFQKEFTKRKWHNDCIEIQFEGRKFFAPREFHQWLVMSYGDNYITPPPPEKRFGHNEISELYIKEV